MSENNIPLIFQTSRVYYIFIPVTLIAMISMGIFFLINFGNDPSIPSPLIPPLIAAVFIISALIISLFIFIKMKQKLTLDAQQIEISTYRDSTILTWEILTSLEVIFTGKITTDAVEAILDILISDTLGRVKINLTSESKTDSISFLRVYLSDVKKLIEKVNMITLIEATGKKSRMKSSWIWKFQK